MAIITEDYVSFEIAKLLKEKGFDEKCRYVWVLDKANNPEDNDGVYKVSSPYFMEGESYVSNEDIDRVLKYSDEYYTKEDVFLCPTLPVAMKWLREVHNIVIVVTPSMFWGKYNVSIYKKGNNYPFGFDGDSLTPSYEEAVEAAIKYCLEHLI